jgi:hypothetical protein
VKTAGGVYTVEAETDGAGIPEVETAGAAIDPTGGGDAMRAGCIGAEPDAEDPTIQVVEEADGAKAKGKIATSVVAGEGSSSAWFGDEDAKGCCE